mmetsp:Transcript_119723/g.350122  ORF Transcript_119723/g.350122 Transcript_119723/m.350122 type:complete len:246 (-) Transcript_119723:71-808(-)
MFLDLCQLAAHEATETSAILRVAQRIVDLREGSGKVAHVVLDHVARLHCYVLHGPGHGADARRQGGNELVLEGGHLFIEWLHGPAKGIPHVGEPMSRGGVEDPHDGASCFGKVHGDCRVLAHAPQNRIDHGRIGGRDPRSRKVKPQVQIEERALRRCYPRRPDAVQLNGRGRGPAAVGPAELGGHGLVAPVRAAGDVGDEDLHLHEGRRVAARAQARGDGGVERQRRRQQQQQYQGGSSCSCHRG